MTTWRNFDVIVLTAIILLILYLSIRKKNETELLQNQLFLNVILLNLLLITVYTLSHALNEFPGEFFRTASLFFNVLLYCIAILTPIFWYLYTDFRIFADRKRLIKRVVALAVIFLLNAGLAVSSLFTGWYFIVDSEHNYHRGPYFSVYFLITLLVYFYTFLLIFFSKKLERQYKRILLLCFIPQIVGVTLNFIFTGVAYTWIGMMLSVLIVYFYIQNRNLSIDFLTSVYNRQQFDSYLSSKIDAGGRSTFSTILIDLNKFKRINDIYGHASGDEALKDAADILKKTLRKNDFIARYGGDEFAVILPLTDFGELRVAVNRIHDAVEEFNAGNSRAYVLSFAMGYDVYDRGEKMSTDVFMRHIDQLMYTAKESGR